MKTNIDVSEPEILAYDGLWRTDQIAKSDVSELFDLS